MDRPRRVQSGKKAGKLTTSRTFEAVPVRQGEHTLYSFSEKASQLWSFVSINRREEDKDEGYQRVLSNSRVRAVADYILAGNIIPGSIIIALDEGKFNESKGTLRVGAGKDVAWVIDGQHRLAGAHLASQEGLDIELNVIALLDLGMSRSLLNIEKRSLPWLTLGGFGLASKDAVG